MLLAAVAICLAAPAFDAADYFPLVPGMKWSYEAKGDVFGAFEIQVTEPVDIAGVATPHVLVMEQGKVSQQTFYNVDAASVSVVGSDPKKPLKDPYPIFRIGEKPTEWEYVGPSPYDDDTSASMHLTGSARKIGARDVLGVRRDCIEVKSEAKIGLSVQTATIFKNTSIYAKGVGLVEAQDSAQSGKKTIKKTVKLVKFEVPGAGS